ncbi:MAG: 30S ribosomal protein S16 [Ignavibacteria bacterium]
MAVKLRLRRMGKKKQPVYKVVAADSRSPRDGKFIEDLGLYNPLTKPHTVNIKEERTLYWLDKGAQPTDTVKSLLREKGITLKRQLKKRGFSEEKIQEELANWAKIREAKLKSKSGKRKSKKQKGAPAPEEKAGKVDIEKSTAEEKGAASENNTTENG